MKKFFVFAIVLGLLLALPVSATVIKGGEEYSLNRGEVAEENLYIATGTAAIAGEVRGDLIIASGTTTVTGLVTGDVQIAGGTVDLMGNVLGDVRIIGGTVNLGGDIGGEFSAVGGTISVLSGSEIKGDFNASGGTAIVNGTIGEDLVGKFGTLVLNGVVRGNVDIEVYEKLNLGNNAQIGGDFVYSAPKQVSLNGISVGGEVEYTKLVRSTKSFEPIFNGEFGKFFVGFFWMFAVMKIAVALVTALLAVYILKKFTKDLVSSTLDDFWQRFVIGLVTAIVVPIVSIVLLFTVVGFIVGGGLLLALMLFGLVAWIYSAVVLGAWFIKIIGKKKELRLDWLTVVVGVAVAFVLSLIPFIGWLVACIFLLATFGSLVYLFYSRLWAKR
jgi:hypothetical protein